MKALKIAAVLAVVVTTMGGCKKEVTQVVNQVYSVTYNINPADWVRDNSGLNYYKIDISVPEVDNTIVSSGAVVVYLSFDNGATFDAVPEDVGGYTYSAFHSLNTVTVGYVANDGSAAALPTGVVLAKIIVLDGQPL